MVGIGVQTLFQMKEDIYQAGTRSRALRLLVTGTGFLADSYDLFVINIVLLMMKENKDYGLLTPHIQANISISALLGAMTGQLIFGILGDRYGRRSTFIYSAVLTILGNLLQVSVQPHESFSIWRQLMVARFIMGIGVGGEYPMSAVITAEVSEPHQRGQNLAAVFSMQGLGRITCALVLVFSAFLITDHEYRWRFSVAFGAIPMLFATFFRWLPETEKYQEYVGTQIPPRKRLKVIFSIVWENRVKLLGTAMSWFIVDVLFYGNSLFSSDVTRAMNTENTLTDKALQNLYVQLFAMPGYLCGIALIDVMGKKNMQMFGFVGEMVIFGVMAAFQPSLRSFPALFVVMYAATFFFVDCGPNMTTYVIPAEIFPTEARSTCHGISAAFGKAGAALGGFLFLRVSNAFCHDHQCDKHSPQEMVNKGLRLVFWCCAALSLLGLVWTWGFVDDEPHPSLQKRLEEDDELSSIGSWLDKEAPPPHAIAAGRKDESKLPEAQI